MASTFSFTLFILYILTNSCISPVYGHVIGAYVLPHGGVALDPNNFNTTNATALLQARELHEACVKVGQAIVTSKPDIIVLSTPHGLADYKNFLIYMNSQAKGEDLFTLLEEMTERVAVVISSDLAHTHQANGPYGYSNTSQPFDDAVGDWARTMNSKSLLVTAANLVDRALSCGHASWHVVKVTVVMATTHLRKFTS